MVKGKQDKKFDAGVIIILLVIVAICVLPLLYVVSVSLTPITELLKNGGFVIIPKKITLVAYKELFSKNTSNSYERYTFYNCFRNNNRYDFNNFNGLSIKS